MTPPADKIVLDECLHLHMPTTGASVFNDGRFGQNPLSHGHLAFYCDDQPIVSNWTECSVSKYCGEKCAEIAIKCFGKYSCLKTTDACMKYISHANFLYSKLLLGSS